MKNETIKDRLKAKHRTETQAVIRKEYEKISAANAGESEARCIVLTASATGFSTCFIYRMIH